MRTGRTRVRLAAGITSIALALGTANVANADGLGQPTPIAWDGPPPNGLLCPLTPPAPGTVLWHFELNRPEAPTPILTATFADAGTINAGFGDTSQYPHFASWNITTGRDTLLSASTDINGLGLGLMYICPGPPAPGETLPGSNVTIAPDYAGGASGVELTFDNVTGSGTTTLTKSEAAPDLPAGFQIGDQAAYYDLSTTATFTGSITVCLSYAGVAPGATSLLHYESGGWVDITSSNDPGNEVICGVTTSLSPFAAVHDAPITFVGFSQPVNDPISASNPVSVFKGGSTIPVKFRLLNADGSPLTDGAGSALVAACGARITLARVGGSAPPVDEVVVSATPNTGNCFRFGAREFTFNLGTRDLAKPATYNITATVTRSDGMVLASHTVLVGIR